MDRIKTVLASASPRRAELLRLAGVDFEALSADIDESCAAFESPRDYICRMARQKALAVCALLGDGARVVIGADTVGVLGDRVLQKPKDYDDAKSMWQAMSGRSHEVWTAVHARLWIDGQCLWQSDRLRKTKVYFTKLSAQRMQDYWATGEPQDKAGAYAIQGGAASWVWRIEGDYNNVVGLPLATTLRLLEEAQKRAIASQK